MARPQTEKPDIDEHGAPIDGQPQTLASRLFMQLHAFGECLDTAPVIEAVRASGLGAAVYEDVVDPRGVAVLTWSEDPAHFVTDVRKLYTAPPFADLWPKQDLTMFGRTYALGHERDLREWLIDKPIATATNAAWPWAVWYPLRRKGAFQQLPKDEQRRILMEHGHIGMAFVQHDLVHDIRMQCAGLDRDDNDFVIGLHAAELHACSAIVTTMRQTIQTSQYLEKLGPFFVGRAVYQHPG